MKNITKVNDEQVSVVITSQEKTKIYNKDELLEREEELERKLVEVHQMLAVFEK